MLNMERLTPNAKHLPSKVPMNCVLVVQRSAFRVRRLAFGVPLQIPVHTLPELRYFCTPSDIYPLSSIPTVQECDARMLIAER